MAEFLDRTHVASCRRAKIHLILHRHTLFLQIADHLGSDRQRRHAGHAQTTPGLQRQGGGDRATIPAKDLEGLGAGLQQRGGLHGADGSEREVALAPPRCARRPPLTVLVVDSAGFDREAGDVRHIDGEQLRAGLPMQVAIEALEEAIRDHGLEAAPQRMHLGDGEQDLLVMPAMDGGWAGVKVVSLDRENPTRDLAYINGTYVLLGPPGLQPRLTMDAPALTEIRTAAVSAVATKHLAREGASRLAIVGTGVQARSHLAAMRTVREISEVVVVGRRRASAEAFAATESKTADVPIRAGDVADVRDADIVCVCTSSKTPVLTRSDVSDGVHINAVGSFRPDVQELHPSVVTGSQVVVELRSAALSEKGDLILARDQAGWDPGGIVADLMELIRDPSLGRRTEEQRTLFASVGHAIEDLVVARALTARLSA